VVLRFALISLRVNGGPNFTRHRHHTSKARRQLQSNGAIEYQEAMAQIDRM
jgi:hypothetical protein